MKVQTAWINPPNQIRGLDHLGAQAPCINIYGQLLPGITNVTDRARYYSFYPWLVWSLHQTGYEYDESFIDRFRRGDCLFTLIAERHMQVVGGPREGHVAAMIGSNNLNKKVKGLLEGKSIRLSRHTNRANSEQYFKNKLGGLGQYYFGPLRDLGVMGRGEQGSVSYTSEIGQQFALAMDEIVPGDLFLKTIEEDWVSPERLEELADFCPCSLKKGQREHELLCDLFFARGEVFSDQDSMPRRHTLQLIMHLGQMLADRRLELGIDYFRACVFSKALPGGDTWRLSEKLEKIRREWAIYQRNEMLSIAAQGLFFALLSAYEKSDVQCDSSAELCAWFSEQIDVSQAIGRLGKRKTFSELVYSSDEWLPTFGDWENEYHEITLAEEIVERCHRNEEGDRVEIIEAALCILIALAAREENQEGYGSLHFPGNYLDGYAVNLVRFQRLITDKWSSMKLKDFLYWICYNWGVENHFRVALRKLRGQSQSTFRLKPTDYGLQIIEIPQAVHTAPRFVQSLRILRDLGILVDKNVGWAIASWAKELMELDDE